MLLEFKKDDLSFSIEAFDPLAFTLLDSLYRDKSDDEIEDEVYRPLERLSSWITPKDVENYYRDNFNINLKFNSISYDSLEWRLDFIATTGDILYIYPSNDQIQLYETRV